MVKVCFRWHTYRYLPYERDLARRELCALLRKEPCATSEGLSLEATDAWQCAAYRTTYFRSCVDSTGSQVVPLQARLEATANDNRPSKLSELEETSGPSLRRQSTRYSAHGLHEYRGKFNPQMVRAIGNILGLQPGDWMLDPFCGSGTSLLEAAHIGWNGIGLDMNPLAVEIARAKVAAMHVPLEALLAWTKRIEDGLTARVGTKAFDSAFSTEELLQVGGIGWQDYLPNIDYLSAWFTESVLVQLAAILDEICRVAEERIKLLLRVLLSDIARAVSLQDPQDLRIRRRKSPPPNFGAVPLYLATMKSKIESIVRARAHLPEITTTQDALLADARQCSAIVRGHATIGDARLFDAAITSPPYATALPYIDTQRLSLVLLSLINAEEIRGTERSVIGNREITNRERLQREQAIETNANQLPAECLSLCQELLKAVDSSKDGFRRRNVPALIYSYLSDMAKMFGQVAELLRPSAPFALVVGRNSTTLGGRTFNIDTPNLLRAVAVDNGFIMREAIELDTFQRFDIHQVNSIRSETLIILERRSTNAG